jgi:hypothetical protein
MSVPDIVFRAGACGNHVRWMLSVDPKFDLTFCPNVAERVQWIHDNIYQSRTWNNWLNNEWTYREHLDSIIRVSHSEFDPRESPMNTAWINRPQLYLLQKDPWLAGLHYFMLNLGMNNSTLDLFVEDCQRWQHNLYYTRLYNESYNMPNKKILYADTLFESELDYTWYKKLIDWAGYSDCYEQAAQIHRFHFQARLRAARDFVDYFKGEHFCNNLEFYQRFLEKN